MDYCEAAGRKLPADYCEAAGRKLPAPRVASLKSPFFLGVLTELEVRRDCLAVLHKEECVGTPT